MANFSSQRSAVMFSLKMAIHARIKEEPSICVKIDVLFWFVLSKQLPCILGHKELLISVMGSKFRKSPNLCGHTSWSLLSCEVWANFELLCLLPNYGVVILMFILCFICCYMLSWVWLFQLILWYVWRCAVYDLYTFIFDRSLIHWLGLLEIWTEWKSLLKLNSVCNSLEI